MNGNECELSLVCLFVVFVVVAVGAGGN